MRKLSCALAIASFFAVMTTSAQDRGLAILAREATGRADFDVGRQVAVIIGIDRYSEWPSLRSAVSEAKRVRNALAERYYIDEFIELYDEAANAEAIRRLFVQELPGKLGLRDSLLVFYAGHGYLDPSKTGFWIASDGVKNEFSQAGWIPNAQIRNYIANLKAQRVLVLADACFSGDFLNLFRGSAPVVDSAYYRKALQLTARQVLTSGASESVPDESEFGRQLASLLERNTERLLDPYSMYERIKLGVTKTLPLMGSLPGNEAGASFVLFLRPQGEGASPASPEATAPPPRPVQQAPAGPRLTITKSYGSLVVKSLVPGALYLDGALMGDLPAGAEARLDGIESGERILRLRYADGASEEIRAVVEGDRSSKVSFERKAERAKPREVGIGDTHAGGIVFYLNGSGGGLAAAPADQSAGARWSDARKLCDGLALNGYSDWRLPTKDELNLMYVNLKRAGLGGLSDGSYWSSTEAYITNAWIQDFSDESRDFFPKAGTHKVRAVRAF